MYSNNELDKFVDLVFSRSCGPSKENSDLPKPFKHQYVSILDQNKKLIEKFEYVSIANATLETIADGIKPNNITLPLLKKDFVKHIPSETSNIPEPKVKPKKVKKAGGNRIMCLLCKRAVSLNGLSIHILQHLPENGVDWLVQCIICKENPCRSLYKSNLTNLHLMLKHEIEKPKENIHYIDRTQHKACQEIIRLTKEKCFPNKEVDSPSSTSKQN